MNATAGSGKRLGLILAITGLIWPGAQAVVASDCVGGDSVCGKLGPLIPFHKDAIHAGLAWTKKTSPKICFWMRPSEYRGSDSVDSSIIPGPTGLASQLRPTFNELVFGRYGFSTRTHGLDESVASRIEADVPLDNGLCFDLTHPDAFKVADGGKFNVADLTDEDFDLNRAAFSNAGHSAGLNYNIFCSGNVALADGKWLFVGGHDKSGNHGIRKVLKFDPDTQTWAFNPTPSVKQKYLADPNGSLFPATDPHLFARDEANTDPPWWTDMRYQRWYPSALRLPNKMVLVLSGTDQISELGPRRFGGPCTDPPTNAGCSKYRIVTPEVIDPKTGKVYALENARKHLAMYPRLAVVQTGKGKHDWKVAVQGITGDPLPTLATLGQYDPWTYTGDTYYLDVLGALKDRNREVPGENFWEKVATAKIAHESGASAQVWELDHKGHAVRQLWALFGGGCGAEPPAECDQSTVEAIDFQAIYPSWLAWDNLKVAVGQNNAEVLPNGNIAVFGGGRGRGPWTQSFHIQNYDSLTGVNGSGPETNIPRHDHSTTALDTRAILWMMGGNRTDLANDPSEAGQDKGVPVAQQYFPAYLFNGPRPVIEKVKQEIGYGNRFKVEVSGGTGRIGSVAIVSFGPVSHNWDWGKRYVTLWSKQIANAKDGKNQNHKNTQDLIVQAPARPGLAVPGYYMLFVLSDEGVPSEAKLVHLDD